MPHLRGKPIGVIPFETLAANSTVIISCSKEAEFTGCKNVMPVPEARKACPDLTRCACAATSFFAWMEAHGLGLPFSDR